ncbi:hypothetical protein OF83DRAFT_437211 [Amylostereum chailletii]|nr:hypothetical protein OF83DRAFT_437211 [Amylostereum chailletii]
MTWTLGKLKLALFLLSAIHCLSTACQLVLRILMIDVGRRDGHTSWSLSLAIKTQTQQYLEIASEYVRIRSATLNGTASGGNLAPATSAKLLGSTYLPSLWIHLKLDIC